MKFYKTLLLVFYAATIVAQTNNYSLAQLKKPINIDGKVDSLWSRANSILLEFQLEPNYGDFPTRKTIVKAAQYQGELYFLFICSINSPEEIAANIQQRDRLNLNDDMVSILLDTYDDNHNAVLFQINPLSTIADAKITSDGKKIDYLWDTKWIAKSSLYSDSWVAEIRIPLSSVQFNSKTKLWGCNFSRSCRANLEINWWQKVTENYRVSQSGQLSGLQFDFQKMHRLEIFPYGTMRYEDSDITGNQNQVKADGGLDIRYNYASNIKASVAVNPDFATVEGDKEQINLTPWELYFPEKRLFFQDGNEMFDTRIQTFYSRRIGDILVGGKINGKIGKYQFNALSALTKQNSELRSPIFNALRLKRDFLKASSIGISYSDKITDTLSFHTFSADYKLNLGKKWKLTGQIVASSPGDFSSHSAWFVRFARENNIYHYHIRYTEIGENFRENVNETGYIRDDDRREMDSDINYKFWFNSFGKYLKLSGNNNIYWSRTNAVLRSWYLTYGARLYLKNKISVDLYYNNEYKNNYKSNFGNFYNHFYRAIIGYNTDENNYVSLSYRKGRNYKRNFNLLEFNSTFQIFKKLSFSYELKYLSFKPDPQTESTTLNIIALNYFYNKDLWMRIFTQLNSNDKRIYVYGLAGWRFKPPFGGLYLIYSTDNYQEILPDDKIKSNIIFLKLTYPINVIK